LRQASVEALRAAIVLWERLVDDAALDDEREVTRMVNGGELGLAERERLTDEAREVLA
jgi:predicted chitinase